MAKRTAFPQRLLVSTIEFATVSPTGRPDIEYVVRVEVFKNILNARFVPLVWFLNSFKMRASFWGRATGKRENSMCDEQLFTLQDTLDFEKCDGASMKQVLTKVQRRLAELGFVSTR
jgi:hypothetical protein